MRTICVVDEMDSSGGIRSKNLHNGNNIPTLIPKSHMNTLFCPDCGQPYDSSAAACPDCGCPNDQRTPTEQTVTPQQPATSTPGTQAAPQPVVAAPQVVQINFDLGAHLAQFATYFYGCALLGWHCLSRRFCYFGGRASRREYWSYTLIIKPCFAAALFIPYIVGGIIFPFVVRGFGYEVYEMVFKSIDGLALLGVLFALILMLIVSLHGLSVSVRRMHDVGKSGWWVLVPFASFFLLFKKGDEEWNIYGEPPVDDI
mgnify:FL=1